MSMCFKCVCFGDCSYLSKYMEENEENKQDRCPQFDGGNDFSCEKGK
jgi:hypothetical protein